MDLQMKKNNNKTKQNKIKHPVPNPPQNNHVYSLDRKNIVALSIYSTKLEAYENHRETSSEIQSDTKN